MTATIPAPSAISRELAELLPPSLHDHCATSAVARGTRLFELGQRPRHMHFVERGEVVLERLGAQGEVVVLQRTRHGFVGEASLQSASYHCDARAVAASVVTRIPVRDIRTALERDPAFAMRWVGMLNREVRRLRMQCERLSLHRLQDRLLHLIETEGRDGCYPLGAGLKSLAGELGVTHEALYRCVAALEQQGLLGRDEAGLRAIPPRG
jgi:CRP-like cAMP-binding protein